MKTGETVRIYPHGDPAAGADATIILVSSNQRSIALSFADMPSFCSLMEICIDPETASVIMLLGRLALDGKPWGPWIELRGGGHYEIESAD